MTDNNSWKEDAWELFLKKYWDSRPEGVDIINYTKEDLEPILSKYTKSGQGEIRIFHYEHEKVFAVKKRGIAKIPLSRSEWALVKKSKSLVFSEPTETMQISKRELTQGMVAGVESTFNTSQNPGETTLLAIANHSGLIADFYNLQNDGTLFTGGRQRANVHIVIDGNQINMSKAQIEIDGGFEWPNDVVIVEMKSSFKQDDFDTNQALLPMLKWKELLKNKNVYSLVLLAETMSGCVEYWAYDLRVNNRNSPFEMEIVKSKKYIIKVV